MSKAALLVMAAGIGSRYGGMKQLEAMGPNDEVMMDYSVYDAVQVGFDKVIFVIRRDFEEEFRKRLGKRISQIVATDYVFQDTHQLPVRFQDKFPFRKKPWGTGHAVLCCRNVVDCPFMVINADDYYGKDAFQKEYQFLTTEIKKGGRKASMVSYELKNTLSDNGAVTRGLCKTNHGMLDEIVETKNIVKIKEGAGILQKDGNIKQIDLGTVVSMNMWGFSPDFMDFLSEGFDRFLDGLPKDDLLSEYLLPAVIEDLIKASKISVKVLRSRDQWFGVTYKEDKKTVRAALRGLIRAGVYPEKLYQ